MYLVLSQPLVSGRGQVRQLATESPRSCARTSQSRLYLANPELNGTGL